MLFRNKPSSQQQQSNLFVVTSERNVTDLREPVRAEPNVLSSELCLLKLLPIKNPVFRRVQGAIEGLSDLRGSEQVADAWKDAAKNVEAAISELDKKRGTLEPVFNPDDNAMMQISKAERGELLIDALRRQLVELQTCTKETNATKTFLVQKQALLALSEVGELLVTKFPYDVPTEGKFSYLPRLQGRCKVTFTIRRRNSILGNVTIIADGYAAPITAGNFVDLSLRNFYTGLPIKFTKRRIGSGSDFEVANIPILGSYNEGFYDPLTAQLRRLPLELIRVQKSSGVPNLAYDPGLTNLLGFATLEPTLNSRPLLSFEIPGLVAMSHPDKNVNGASTEFFSLQQTSMLEDKRVLLDGEYAPFGYIVDSYDLFQTIQPNDVIDSTYVDEWGQLNLVKLRQASFSEIVQGSEEAEK